jgi:16S rRNA (guanine527-N7)-methyltransferase
LTLSDVLQNRLRAVDVVLTTDQVAQLARYYDLLAKWNRRLNLTSLTLNGFPAASIDRLLVEPISAVRNVKPSDVWFDFGSGGGSPAIPMKILLPGSRLTMVEARGRKAAFLREAVRYLNLRETSVLQLRIEDLPSEANGTVDLITVRAVSLSGAVLEAALRVLKPGAILAAFAREPPEIGSGFKLLSSNTLLTGTSVYTLQRAS